MRIFWVGPALERARYSVSEPVTYYCFVRLDGIYGKPVAQVYGHSPDEATKRARAVKSALEAMP